MSKLLILGAGGHGKVVAEIALLMGKWDEIAFLDDKDGIQHVLEISVIGRLDDYESLKDEYKYAFVALGNNQLRLKWIDSLIEKGFILPTLSHPTSVISKTCNIGIGTVVMAGAVINANTVIGKGCIINTSSSVDHDCLLFDGVHISPGAHIGGTVKIGQQTWICIGSSIANDINIGSKVIVAAGATVIHHISDSIMVAGIPAKKIKEIL